MYPLVLRIITAIRSLLGFSDNVPGEVSGNIPVSGPELHIWTTCPIAISSFVKVGRIAMGDGGLEIYSDIDERRFILLNEDIDAVLDGDTRNIRLLGERYLVGSPRLSKSGRALNITIFPFYYTIPLRSVLALLEGRNRKGVVFMGK